MAPPVRVLRCRSCGFVCFPVVRTQDEPDYCPWCQALLVPVMDCGPDDELDEILEGAE